MLPEDSRTLKNKLKMIIETIQLECSQARGMNRMRSTSDITPNEGQPINSRKRLDYLMGVIAEKRHMLARRKQAASSRVVEDEIVATKKKLEEVNDEIHGLESEKIRQEKTLASLRSSPLVDELHAEIANQRKHQGELRRANTELERQLRARQRICAQLEDQLQSGSQLRSSRDSVRSASKREETMQAEIQLFEEEQAQLAQEIADLEKRILLIS